MSATTAHQPQPAHSAASSQQTPSGQKSDFMAAEEIKAILQGREKAEQEKIIRWVMESLGLNVIPVGGAGHAGTALTSPHAQAEQHVSVASLRPKDIKSFVAERKPKSDLQFAAVAAYYLQFQAPQPARINAISAQDLQEAGRLARGYGFKKPLVTLNNAVRQGYFDRAGRGQFKLNAVGENLVVMALPSAGADTKNRTTRRPRRKQSRKRHSKPNKTSTAS